MAEEMIPILYNKCFGGFSESKLAYEMYYDVSLNENSRFCIDAERHDPKLVDIFLKLGKKFNGQHARIGIIYIPKKYLKYYRI